MRPRQEITDMFSTFAQLDCDRFSKWLPHMKLRQNIQKCFDSMSEVESEEFWALYWHKYWQKQSSPIAKMHLCAYLQEPCYWAAEKVVIRFANSYSTIADYFQIANAEIEIILKTFNPEKCYSLKHYANIAIPSRLRDILRQRKETHICSNWFLLRKVSKKLFLEALSQAGLSPNLIAEYRLAWVCFKELYIQKQPQGLKGLPEPNRELWEQIANLYNCEYPSQICQVTGPVKSETIENWLVQTALCIRTYLYPSFKSLDSIVQHDTTQTLDLPDVSSESPLDTLIIQEEIQYRKSHLSEISTVLLKASQYLDKKTQQILECYYQQGMTQQQIAQKLELSQATASRKLTRGRESLLAALVKWCQESMNISVNSNQVKDMSFALEEWLRNQYGNNNMSS